MKAHCDSSLIVEECLDELLSIPNTTEPNSTKWFQKKTVILANDNVTQYVMERLHPLLLFALTMISYWIFDSLWPMQIVMIGIFSICRLLRWINSQILSKLWLYNVSLFYDRQRNSNCLWLWRDRTCIDVYTFCLLDRATAVPSDLPKVILDQANETSIAIILDRPRHLIEQHLKQRMNSPTTSRSFAIATWLILYIGLPIRYSMDALQLVERFYLHLGIPVIKISDIDSQLEHDTITGDIEWNPTSMTTLLITIQKTIQKRDRPIVKTIDESFLPWQNQRGHHLYC